jgi:predicted secreted protein
MPIASSIAIYVITWWLVLFAVLPFGVRNREEASSDASFLIPGTDAGAPQKPMLLKKLIATSLVSVPVAILLQLFIQYVE